MTWHVLFPRDNPLSSNGLALCGRSPIAGFVLPKEPEVWRDMLKQGVCEDCLRGAQELLGTERLQHHHWLPRMKLGSILLIIERALWPAEAARMEKARGEETPYCTDPAYLEALRAQGFNVAPAPKISTCVLVSMSTQITRLRAFSSTLSSTLKAPRADGTVDDFLEAQWTSDTPSQIIIRPVAVSDEDSRPEWAIVPARENPVEVNVIKWVTDFYEAVEEEKRRLTQLSRL